MVGDGQHALSTRASGTLTGSRTAGALGRILVEDVFAHRHAYWHRWGFKLGGPLEVGAPVISAAAYVDNVYAVSATAGGPIAILEEFATDLRRTWGLAIKDSSRECMVRNAQTVEAPLGWKLESEMNVLGFLLAANSSTALCVDRAISQAWNAFLGELRGKGPLRSWHRGETPALGGVCLAVHSLPRVGVAGCGRHHAQARPSAAQDGGLHPLSRQVPRGGPCRLRPQPRAGSRERL